MLKELVLSGYDKTLEGSAGWLVIKGESLDSLTSSDLSNITSSLGRVTDAEIKDSTTLIAKYIIPDLSDDSVVGKTETLTIAGKTVSAPLHTLKISYNLGSYVVVGCHSIPSDGKVQIPAYVASIYINVFKNCTNLTEVKLPASLTSIKKSAFKDCTKLTSVVFASPEGWAVYDDWQCKNKHADIQKTDLENAATAAEYLLK